MKIKSNGLICPICNKKQFETPSGDCCKNGHGGVDGILPKKMKKKREPLKLNHIYLGDVKTVLPALQSSSVDCVITSPPYWNLRDYGTGKWIGGSKDCDHIKNQAFSSKTTIHKNRGEKVNKGREIYYIGKCGKCGAIKKDLQIGAESTPEEFTETMVKLFQQIKRILKPTGTVWLNLGDTYIGGGKGSGTGKQLTNKGSLIIPPRNKCKLQAKNLTGIPWRVALALQADGWILRQEIIWNKPSCMPEAVKDRCTKSHEHIFLLVKSQKYYFDHKKIQEPSLDPESYTGRRPRNPDKFGKDDPERYALGVRADGKLSMTGKKYPTRNKRTVWSVPISNYKGGHFACFPPKLITPCVLAGCPKGGVVLDCFMGSGTVGAVAKKYHRNYVGIELNPKYKVLAEQRINGTLQNLF